MAALKKYSALDSPIGDFCQDALTILGDEEVIDFADLYDLVTMHTTEYGVVQAFFEFKLMCSLLLQEEAGGIKSINDIIESFANDKAIETHLGILT